MAKEKDTRRPAVGSEQPAKRNRRGGSGASSAEKPKAASSGRAAAKTSGGRKAGGDDRERRVRDRAYEIWQQEGRPSGREREHWEQAERET